MEKTMTLYVSNVQGRKTNVSYPYEAKISSLEELKNAVQYDHVCAEYADKKGKNGQVIPAYRSKNGFMFSDCLPMDCDNSNPNPLQADLSEKDWKTPADVQKAFPGVSFYVSYSRNHMKEKDGKAPRPKFHVYFPLKDKFKSLKKYEQLKRVVLAAFPSFDNNAVDGARFFFGVKNPQVEYFAGEKTIDEFLASELAAADFKLPKKILTGSRNNTLLSIALKALKRFGEKIAMSKFIEAAKKCEDQLPREELEAIWKNAVNFYENKIADENYVLPEEFNNALSSPLEEEDKDSDKLTTKDVEAVLRAMGVTIRLNVITGKVVIKGLSKEHSDTNAANVLPTDIRDYFARHYDLNVSRQFIEDSLLKIEDANRFNPIEDMLNKTKHDGQDRLKMLRDILTINDIEALYLRKWLHQCIALALNNDINDEPFGADGVLVIQGKQGKGKTLFCRKLAVKAEWFAEGISIDTDNKDSIIQATSKWIAELGELDATLKREQSSLKAFISSSMDIYRQPYGRVAVDKPRRTSFCATVNPKEFLNDDTGSRRFWVIQPKKIDVQKLKSLNREWFCQLWRQVYEELYLPDPQGFHLTDEERARLEQDNTKYSKPMPGEIEIMDTYDWEASIETWKWKSTTDVIRDIGKNITTSQIGRALQKLMDWDNRIQEKSPKNKKSYFLPPTNDGFLAC